MKEANNPVAADVSRRKLEAMARSAVRSYSVLVRVFLAIVLAACMMATSGCETYGSKVVKVRLTTQPADKPARAYLVPLDEWDKLASGAAMVQPYTPENPDQFRARLQRWYVSERRTPITTTALPHQMYYVVEWQGRYQWRKIRPGTEPEFDITLETQP